MDESAFFCNICGGPPAFRKLITRASLQHLDEEEQFENYEAYEGHCECQGNERSGHSPFCPSMLGYDARNISLKNIKWLGDVRLVCRNIPDANLFTDKDSADLPMVTPLGEHLKPQSGRFFYPCIENPRDPGGNILTCNKDGFLVHDTCLKILKLVHQHTVSAARPLDLRDFVSVMESGLKDRNSDSYDWGYGDTFGRKQRFDAGDWVPSEYSEWTVMDPSGPFDLKPLITEASTESDNGYSFAFHTDTINAHLYSTNTTQNNPLSSIPRELQYHILESLPTESVLNLFLASPDLRECAGNLPRSFWESRLFFDVPWCAETVLSQLPPQSQGRAQFNHLFGVLKDASAVEGYADVSMREYLALKNRRRIWLNCERILRDIESYRASLGQEQKRITVK
ncbi:hypothetical protein ETB97_005712 [Aspergillus alliaceus]|uniref:F-box domain-containing protein n=1 Tax=Petromyces alliaceus TaxID=209559 RepID=A0A8H5ZVA1_PETAA|nr:hypothetical protein ETB97_005712 [Aspergillus burnettii]